MRREKGKEEGRNVVCEGGRARDDREDVRVPEREESDSTTAHKYIHTYMSYCTYTHTHLCTTLYYIILYCTYTSPAYVTFCRNTAYGGSDSGIKQSRSRIPRAFGRGGKINL
jgi:uncharacterized membrane protein